MPQLRESGKKPGSARDARDHCCGVRKERGRPVIGASCSVCSDGRKLPTQAPGAGVSCGCYFGPQKQAQWLLLWTRWLLLLLPPRGL